MPPERALDAASAVASALQLNERLMAPIIQGYVRAYRQTGQQRELTFAHELCREWAAIRERSEVQLDVMEELVQAMMGSYTLENLRKVCSALIALCDVKQWT